MAISTRRNRNARYRKPFCLAHRRQTAGVIERRTFQQERAPGANRTQDIPTGTRDGREPNAGHSNWNARPARTERKTPPLNRPHTFQTQHSGAARGEATPSAPPRRDVSPWGKTGALAGASRTRRPDFPRETDAPAGAFQNAPSPFEKAVERRAASLAAIEPRRRAEQPSRALTPCRPISGRL